MGMERVRLVSSAFKQEWVDEIFKEVNAYTQSGHWLYPSDEHGRHLKGFFTIKPILNNERFLKLIGDDMIKWAQDNHINFDVIFSPAQPVVKNLANYVAKGLGKKTAFWEYLPTGRFGEKLVEGTIEKDDKVIVFNGVSQQGRCVGYRLPQFVKKHNGVVVAAAVFAKGKTSLISEVEKKFGKLFYSTIQIEVNIYDPDNCPICQENEELKPWQDFLKETKSSN